MEWWLCLFEFTHVYKIQTRCSDKQALLRSLHKGQTSYPGILEHLSEYTRGQTARMKAGNSSLGTPIWAPGDRLQKGRLYSLRGDPGEGLFNLHVGIHSSKLRFLLDLDKCVIVLASCYCLLTGIFVTKMYFC